MGIVKKIRKTLSLAACIALFSCATTKIEENVSRTESQPEIPEAQDEKNPNKNENSVFEEEAEKKGEKTETFYEFCERIRSLKIELVEIPKETVKKSKFSGPFTAKISVGEDSVPLSKIKIDVKFPSSRNPENFEAEFSTVTLDIREKTDFEGTVEFAPPIPEFSFDERISFFPHFDPNVGDIEKFSQEAMNHGIQSDYRVKTDMRSRGGVVSLIEFKKDGSLLGGSLASSRLLMGLMKVGFTGIGNDNDNFEKAIRSGSEQSVFDAAKKYNGTVPYLIFGTLRHFEPDTQENAQPVNLVAEVTCMNLKATDESWRILFKTVQYASGKDLASARDAIAQKIASAVNYGM